MVIQLLRGHLPWQGIGGANKLEKYSNILDIKMQTVEEILCKDLPEQFCKFLKYVKELEYEEKPDYKRLRHEFRVLFMDKYVPPTPNVTFKYDWQLVPEGVVNEKGQKNKGIKKPMNIVVSALSPGGTPLPKRLNGNNEASLNQDLKDQLNGEPSKKQENAC